jgi:hypothetical protein
MEAGVDGSGRRLPLSLVDKVDVSFRQKTTSIVAGGEKVSCLCLGKDCSK